MDYYTDIWKVLGSCETQRTLAGRAEQEQEQYHPVVSNRSPLGEGARCSSVEESLRWVVGSIPHGEPTKLFFVPASVPRLV